MSDYDCGFGCDYECDCCCTCGGRCITCHGDYDSDDQEGEDDEYSLSKLEYVSTAILQGMLANPSGMGVQRHLRVEEAVKLAKRLLAECYIGAK